MNKILDQKSAVGKRYGMDDVTIGQGLGMFIMGIVDISSLPDENMTLSARLAYDSALSGLSDKAAKEYFEKMRLGLDKIVLMCTKMEEFSKQHREH